MRNKSTKPNPKLQEKRAKLIELSAKAKSLRQQKIKTAKTPEEALFWQSRTINYMLLNYIYSNGDTRYETFHEWKEQGATIKKGAKATIIWGQPRTGTAMSEQKTKDDTNAVRTDAPAEEYEFFPLCFLFAESDVYFPNTDLDAETTAESIPAVVSDIIPIMDNSAFNDL